MFLSAVRAKVTAFSALKLDTVNSAQQLFSLMSRIEGALMDGSSRAKRVIFSAILILVVLALTELFASEALLFRMRLSNDENFSKHELSYSSAVNIVDKIGFQAGIFPDRYRFQVRLTFEPQPHRAADPELGYRELPGKYRVTYSRKFADHPWEHLRLQQTTNKDGTRWTGEFDPNYKSSIYILGDSFVHGDGVSDEQTFSALLQQSRRDLRVRLFALGGWGLVQSYVNFNKIKSEIRPEDIIVIGYADFLDVRHVMAPSNLRAINKWHEERGQSADNLLLPSATVNAEGRIEISPVQQLCSINKSYCQRSEPSKSEMAKVSAALINHIAANTEARVFVLHYDKWGIQGDPRNPVFDLLDSKIVRISALASDFDYFISDDVVGFDPHPGPYWHYALSRKLIDVLAPSQAAANH